MGLQTFSLETQVIFLESVVIHLRKFGVLELIFKSSKGKRPFLSFDCIEEAIFISYWTQIWAATSVQHYIILSLLEFKVSYFSLLSSLIFASHWNVVSVTELIRSESMANWRRNAGIRLLNWDLCVGIERHQLPWDIWLMETYLTSVLLPICLTSEDVGQY